MITRSRAGGCVSSSGCRAAHFRLPADQKEASGKAVAPVATCHRSSLQVFHSLLIADRATRLVKGFAAERRC